MDEKRRKALLYLVYAAVAVAFLLSLQLAHPFRPAEITYSEFLNRLEAGEVVKAVITESRIEGTIRIGDEGQEKNFVTTRIPNTDIEGLIQKMEEKGVQFSGKVENTFWRDLLFSWLIPIGILVLVWFLVFRRLSRRVGGASPLSFGQSKVKIYDRSKDRVTFDDVAGLDEAKEELKD